MIEIGIAGAILLLIAWLFETYESVKRHKALIDLKFAFIYIISTALLTIYAFQRSDYIFFSINFCLIILVLFEIFYTIYKTRR
ncbi:MAG: hypothetical protein QXK49_02495 [Candidatus Aenigmatarchaeota archaeon]